jgi:saccharopine dehydrogenase (NAD+, L-lysine-forming)
VLRASVLTRTHYLDLSNDLGPVLSVLRADADLTAVGVSATPAVGFGTVATDGLARLLTERVHDGIGLRLGMAIGSSGGSRGVAASTLEVVRAGARRLDDGVLERAPLGRGAFRAPAGGPVLVPVGLADLAITPLTTGIRSVTVGVAMPLPRSAARLLLPLVAAAARRLPALPGSRTVDRDPVSRAWAELLRPDGSSVAAWLTAGDGFRFSAEAAVAAAERVLGGDARPGAGTASGRWGSAFLAGLPGVAIGSSGV